jgi:nitrous oxidase accessory protein NosD
MKFSPLSAMAAVLFLVAPVFAQQGPRSIFFSGAVINEPGTYKLTRDLTIRGSEVAVQINASNVTLDLDGFQIMGPGTNSGIGIQISNGQTVVVKNGNITDMSIGIRVADSQNVTVTGLNIRGRGLPPPSGAPPETAVMIVQSSGVVISHNSIFGTGLGVFVRGGMSRGNRIEGNTITASTNGILAICYNPTPTDTRSPRYDLIYNNLMTGYQGGIQFAASSGVNIAKGNTIFHTTRPAIEVNGTGSQDLENVKVQIQ